MQLAASDRCVVRRVAGCCVRISRKIYTEIPSLAVLRTDGTCVRAEQDKSSRRDGSPTDQSRPAATALCLCSVSSFLMAERLRLRRSMH